MMKNPLRMSLSFWMLIISWKISKTLKIEKKLYLNQELLSRVTQVNLMTILCQIRFKDRLLITRLETQLAISKTLISNISKITIPIKKTKNVSKTSQIITIMSKNKLLSQYKHQKTWKSQNKETILQMSHKNRLVLPFCQIKRDHKLIWIHSNR